MTNTEVFEGLEQVVVARTRLSQVDGQGGHLTIAGYPIEELAGRVGFEDMALLLLTGALPDAATRRAQQSALGRERVLAHTRLCARAAPPLGSDVMSALRSALSLLPPNATPTALLATAAVATARSCREAAGEESLSPNPELGHAADLLRTALGRDVALEEAALLDAYLVTVAEHGFNASTFATRVVASTGADLVAAVVSGVSALSGPLHGGAPGPVLDLLDRVGSKERATAVIRAELAAGRRIVGMGHRVYRVRDPRAFVLERAIRRFESADTSARLELARAVEAAAETELAAAHPERALKANVEFYTAVLLDTLSLPRTVFTAFFACARIAGYSAHYAEQRAEGRLIRPSALYVGPRAQSPAA
jgi:citrate synthase